MEAHGRIAVVAVDHAAVVNQAEALTIPIDLIESSPAANEDRAVGAPMKSHQNLPGLVRKENPAAETRPVKSSILTSKT
jgi:hypothetical protein